MKKYLWILLLLPSLCFGATGDLQTIGGKVDTAITSIAGKAGTAIATICGKNYTDGDAGCTPTIAYVAMAESETPGTSIDKPTGTSDGHIMIAGCISDTAEAMTMSGWTGITTVDSSSSRLTVAYKVASSEGASYQFTSATADDSCFIATFSTTCGTWKIQDYDSSAATAQTIDTTAVTAVNNSMLVVVFGDDDALNLGDMPENYDMTRIMDLSTDTRGIVSWYQAASAGNYTKTIDNTGYSHDLSTISVILFAE